MFYNMITSKIMGCVLTIVFAKGNVHSAKYYKLPEDSTITGTMDVAYSNLDDCFVGYVKVLLFCEKVLTKQSR